MLCHSFSRGIITARRLTCHDLHRLCRRRSGCTKSLTRHRQVPVASVNSILGGKMHSLQAGEIRWSDCWRSRQSLAKHLHSTLQRAHSPRNLCTMSLNVRKSLPPTSIGSCLCLRFMLAVGLHDSELFEDKANDSWQLKRPSKMSKVYGVRTASKWWPSPDPGSFEALHDRSSLHSVMSPASGDQSRPATPESPEIELHPCEQPLADTPEQHSHITPGHHTIHLSSALPWQQRTPKPMDMMQQH